jgi:hypothetical protein
MNKLKAMAILSSIASNITWAASNIYRTAKNVSKKTVNSFRTDGRFDVEIFKGNEQIDKKHNLTHQQLLDVVNTLSVFPNLSIIVSSSDGKGESVVINL